MACVNEFLTSIHENPEQTFSKDFLSALMLLFGQQEGHPRCKTEW